MKRTRTRTVLVVSCTLITLLAGPTFAIGRDSTDSNMGKSAEPGQKAAHSRPRTARSTSAASLQKLLDESGLDYAKDKEGFFKIVVTAENETTLIYAQEASIGNGDDAELKLISLGAGLITVPQGFKHPPAMLRKMAEINDRLLVGKVGLDSDRGNVWYTSSLWLQTATAKTLVQEVYLAHYLRIELRKQLLPFIQE